MSKRIGSQTPTQSLFLPYKDTLSGEAVMLYQESGRTAYEWQINLLNEILAINEDGLWTHMKFGYSIPRQNGKNEVVAIRELIGLKKGEKMLHTAHRTTTSAAAFNRLLAIMEESGMEEKTHFNKIKAIGRESIELIGGGRIDFRTRTSTGGLGESFDLLVIDEAQEYTIDQESALKYTVTDADNPQTIMCGTPPTPVSSGTVFTNYRETVLNGGLKYSAWAELSTVVGSSFNTSVTSVSASVVVETSVSDLTLDTLLNSKLRFPYIVPNMSPATNVTGVLVSVNA